MANFSKMTVAQLDEFAREKGITYPDNVTTKSAKAAYLDSVQGDDVTLEIGDVSVSIPVSRASDIRVLRALRDGERAEAENDTRASLFASLDLIDAVFGEVSDEVENALRRPDGTISTVDVISCVRDYLQAADAKN